MNRVNRIGDKIMDHPRTKEDFLNHRYGIWAGAPHGQEYQPELCAMEVYDRRAMIEHQCYRKNGHGQYGLYCKQHAKRRPAK